MKQRSPGVKPMSEVIQETGLSYRQIDHWCRVGWVPGIEKGTGVGSGHWRGLSEFQVQFLKIMSELTVIGFRPEPASKLAAVLIYTSTVTLEDLGYTITREMEK